MTKEMFDLEDLLPDVTPLLDFKNILPYATPFEHSAATLWESWYAETLEAFKQYATPESLARSTILLPYANPDALKRSATLTQDVTPESLADSALFSRYHATPSNLMRSAALLQYATADARGNRLLSEVGLRNVLLMLRAAASGSTLAELNAYLGEDTEPVVLPYENAASSLNFYLMCTEQEGKVAMKPQYSKILAEDFHAKAYLFTPPEAEQVAQEANNFIARNTHGLINNFFASGTLGRKEYLASLVNVLSFKSEWRTKFREFDKFEFKPAGSKKVLVPGLETTDATYLLGSNFEGMRKDYASEAGHSYSFYAFLPRGEGSALDNTPLFASSHRVERRALDLSKLDFSDLKNDLGKDFEFTVRMPRFDFRTRTNWTNYLQSQGVVSPFNKLQANLTAGFCWPEAKDVNVCVDNIEQETKIEVNAKGTKAAAVTHCSSGLFTIGMAETKPRIHLDFDSPFVFFIYDNTIKEPLFAGVVNNPA